VRTGSVQTHKSKRSSKIFHWLIFKGHFIGPHVDDPSIVLSDLLNPEREVGDLTPLVFSSPEYSRHSSLELELVRQRCGDLFAPNSVTVYIALGARISAGQGWARARARTGREGDP
jgi:hypothetical protein